MIKPKSNIHKIKTYVPGKPIEKIKDELGIEGDICKYNSNENPLGPPSKAISAIQDALCHCHLYPDDSQCNLKEKLSERHSISQDRLIVGNGSVELIMLAGLAFLGPEDNIVLSDVSFIMPKIVAQIVGCKTNVVACKNYTHDLPGMLEAINPSTRIVYIDNPNNPTGTHNTKTELDSFIRKVPEHVLVILDEAYYEYAVDYDFPDSAAYLADGKNVLILRTFSKIYGLAGLRIGYGMSHSEIIEGLMKVRTPFNVSRLAHLSACAAMDDHEHLEESIRVNSVGKDMLYAEFDALGLDYEKSSANFILVHFKQSAVEVSSKLQKLGLITRTCLEYGLKNSLRITIADMESNERLVWGLKKIL